MVHSLITQASITAARRVEEENQAKSFYQRQLAEYNEKIADKEIQVTLIEQRLELAEDRIEYTRKKKWTNYISANPVNIIQNIFGGGDVQRDNIAIASLEIRTADLLAAKAELERQQEEEEVKIGDLVHDPRSGPRFTIIA